jgi:ABC-type hemin transport system ATPase subunit
LHPEIVPFLERENLQELKKSLWISYINENRQLYDDMVNKYQLFAEAVNAVDLSDNPWKQALDVFNKRFSVPFKMKVVNLKSAIIGESIPQIEFSFQKDQRSVSISRSRLEEINTLSQGEKRALYLLNIIFDLEKIKASGESKLLIIDDIADSFDYKNKYAIIEYLYELSNESNIKMIILSHNYDFYRTISSRLSISRQCRLFADKDTSKIVLVQEKYQNQPFDYWKENPNQIHVMALIPFVRNLAEFGKERYISGTGDNADYLMLTSLLHEKNNTHQIKFADILPLYDEYMGINTFKSDIKLSDPVIQTLYSVCNTITYGNTALEYKILLSIAIRHKAENFMIQKIKNYAGQLVWDKGRITGNSIDFLNYVYNRGNQTRELMNGYNQFGDNIARKIISEVNIMTPENIHLNSFMYEPILDMDIIELLNLYNQVKCL